MLLLQQDKVVDSKIKLFTRKLYSNWVVVEQ